MNSNTYTQPNVNNQGVIQPGVTQPGVNLHGVNQPGVNQPGVCQQGMNQPGVCQPVQLQPGMPQPGVIQPGVTQPGYIQPGVIHPVPGQTGVNHPGVIQPDNFNQNAKVEYNKMGFGENYIFSKQAWKTDIKDQAKEVFHKNANGKHFFKISPQEVPNLINILTQQNGSPAVPIKDIYYVLSVIDDGKGTIDKSEFILLVKILAGQKDMTEIKAHKMKHNKVHA